MTNQTEAERAEFEAAYVAEKLRIIRSEGSADGEKAIRAVMLRRNANGDYDNSLEAHFAWWAWQAARRAPAAPVPLRKPTVAQVSDAIGYHASAWDCVDPRELIDAILMLAAAPQPPEAAPVELPEYGIDTANHAGIRVRGYTEQQVRDLLAAQASVSNGTLASQPPFQTEAGAARQLEEIAVLVRVLVRALRKADPANPRAARALDYLKRHGLQGNPLRAPGD